MKEGDWNHIQQDMFTQPFCMDDVKQAIFDIDDIKAPGPDGYSSCFYKKSWSTIGKDVTQAVLDFLYFRKVSKADQ